MLLLEAGASPNATMADGTPMLALAVLAGEPDMVRLLLSFGADPASVPRHLWDLHGADSNENEPEGNSCGIAAEDHASNWETVDMDSSVPKAYPWCTADMCQSIEREMTWAMRYWFRQAMRLPKLTSTMQKSLQVGALFPLTTHMDQSQHGHF